MDAWPLMSLLFRAQASHAEQRAKVPDYIVERMFDETPVSVDMASAMRHDAVWSCRTRIARDVAMLPTDVVRYVNGEREAVNPTPQIIAAPSVTVRPLDWRYQIVDAWLGSGNAFGLVTQTTANGAYPTRIELVGNVRIDQSTASRPRFFIAEREHFLWPVGDLWHVPGYTLPGSSIGLSPIAYHAATITHGLAASKFGSDFFTSGGHPTGILSPESDPKEEGARRLKEKFLEATRRRQPVVLPQSVKYTAVQINPDDSQFIDAMRYTAEQICRIYGEDPADHGVSASGSSITYANRSDADLARFKRRQFWVVKLQDALSELLPRPQVVRLNVDAALMMTARERHEVHKLRLDSRTTTVNEVRTVEDEPTFKAAEFNAPGIPPLPAATPAATA